MKNPHYNPSNFSNVNYVLNDEGIPVNKEDLKKYDRGETKRIEEIQTLKSKQILSKFTKCSTPDNPIRIA